MNKYNIIIIGTNIILGIIKFIIIATFAIAAFLDDYLIPLSKTKQYMTFSVGVMISLILDILVNFIITKIMKKKNIEIKYRKMMIISIIITIIETIIILNS